MDTPVMPTLRDVAFGRRFERNRSLLAAAVVFFRTFVAYATGVFAVGFGAASPVYEARAS